MANHRKYNDTEKWCPRCKQWKEHADFGVGSMNSKRGLQTYCKSCFSEYQKPKTAEYREKNRIRLQAQNVDNQRLSRYGLTPEKYQAMWEAQNGKCFFDFCGRPASAIDHDHQTDEVRALLCKFHNVAIGAFEDNAVFLRQAAEYLENHRGRKFNHKTASGN